jgi:hypothetical protein
MPGKLRNYACGTCGKGLVQDQLNGRKAADKRRCPLVRHQ